MRSALPTDMGGFLNRLQGTMKEQTETEMAGESNLRLFY